MASGTSPPCSSVDPTRAIVFVDGNNWYHGLKNAGVHNIGDLNYRKISQKLCGPRIWCGLRYYVGKVENSGNTRLYSEQRAFVDRLRKSDPKISVHFGRLEPRNNENQLSLDLLNYVDTNATTLGTIVSQSLRDLARTHLTTRYMVEKAVDVMLAVDLVTLAQSAQYDVAYILSADGDYTHAVEFVRSLNKKVFVAHPSKGHQLCGVANTYVRTDQDWLRDCYSQ